MINIHDRDNKGIHVSTTQNVNNIGLKAGTYASHLAKEEGKKTYIAIKESHRGGIRYKLALFTTELKGGEFSLKN